MEVLPGVHQIAIDYKGRPLQLYLLRFGGESLLMDCGEAANPGKDILPYFAKIGMKPSELTHVMLTHPDVDHTGGLHALAEACPHAKFYCGTDDRTQIETPEGLAIFVLGANAAKWCEKIVHPKSRLEKLGVKSGATVCLLAKYYSQ